MSDHDTQAMVQEVLSRAAELAQLGIVPERLYKPEEAAGLLGIDSKRAAKTLSEIPEELLPVHRVGPQGGLKRYYGRNLIQYIRSTGKVLKGAA